MIKVLVLGYSKKETSIIDFLRSKKKIHVINHNKKVTKNFIEKFNLVICFGYRHIIDQSIIKTTKVPLINLHIGYLPYNRGSHPNFWSFVENTPSGVTIHQIDGGIDSGKIIYQKHVNFDLHKNKSRLTFSNSYTHLINEIESLFKQNFDNLVSGKYQVYEQIGLGSFHMKKDLPRLLKSWNQNVYKTVRKYHLQQKKLMIRNLDIIDQIENTRKNNNINWMNIIRTSLNSSSKETLKILNQINLDDRKISALFKKFNNEK